MHKINNTTELRLAILDLERSKEVAALIVKQGFENVYESIKPINLIKNTFNEVVQSNEIQNNVVNSSVGLAAGYLSKVLIQRGSKNPFKKLLGTALMFGVTNLVTKHPEVVSSVSHWLLNTIKKKDSKEPDASSESLETDAASA